MYRARAEYNDQTWVEANNVSMNDLVCRPD